MATSITLSLARDPRTHYKENLAKWALVACVLSTVAGIAILTLGATQYFGALSSAGCIASLTLGISFTWIALSGVIAAVIVLREKCIASPTPSLEDLIRKLEPFPAYYSWTAEGEMYRMRALEDSDFESDSESISQDEQEEQDFTLPIAPQAKAAEPSFPYADLPSELKLHVMHFTQFHELESLGNASRMDHAVRQTAVLDRARSYGYEGANVVEARTYMHQFLNQIHIVWQRYLGVVGGLESSSDLETYAIILQSFNTECIYEIYARLSVEDLKKCPLISKYFLKLIIDGLIKATPIPKNLHNKPLTRAIFAKDENAALLLLTLGVDPNKMSELGLPLFCAAQVGCDEILSLLLKYGAEVNKRDLHNNTALISVFQEIKLKCEIEKTVSILLEHGADPNLADGIGNRPLHAAAHYGCDKIVEKLLDHGAHINALGAHGIPAIFYPFIQVNNKRKLEKAIIDVVHILLAKGVNPNVLDNLGATPLHHAAALGYNEVVTLLLENGALVDHQGNIGKTPLHLAAEYRQKSTVRLLAAHGADTSILVEFI